MASSPRPPVPFAVLAAVAAAVAGLAVGFVVWGPRGPEGRGGPDGVPGAAVDTSGRATAPPGPAPPGHATEQSWPAHIRWIAAGGGGDPAYNEVSLEQDLALAREVLGDGGGVLLHAGGGGVDGVRVRDDRAAPARFGALAAPPDGDRGALVAALAELFDPADRAVRFRPSELEGAWPATHGLVSDALRRGLSEDSSEPLLFFFSGHGEEGEVPRQNTVHTWGGWGLSAADVADLLTEVDGPRPAVFVVAACFSGGFAELVFADGDAASGEVVPGRCGVFASTADRESAGCDPDPDRGAQGGYSMHFLNALRGRDAAGAPLPPGAVDYDGDGRVSVLDAHTRARIASTSIDVPTTTSEAWLRRVFQEPSDAPASPSGASFTALPEEQAVIAALGARFGLAAAEAVEARLDELEVRLDAAADRLDALDADVNDAWGAARIALLERWPVLGDPYHRDYAETLARRGELIARWLDDAPEVRAWLDARAALDAADGFLDLEADYAALLRLERAHRTVAEAAALEAEAGDRWRTFEALRACERSVVPDPGPGR